MHEIKDMLSSKRMINKSHFMEIVLVPFFQLYNEILISGDMYTFCVKFYKDYFLKILFIYL